MAGRMHAVEQFAGEPGTVAAARHFVSRTLHALGIPDDDAVLLVSELATNAVIHARSAYRVDIDCQEGTARVEVTDEDPTPPKAAERGRVAEGALGGRGLALVVSMACRWGYDVANGSKTVWFEI